MPPVAGFGERECRQSFTKSGWAIKIQPLFCLGGNGRFHSVTLAFVLFQRWHFYQRSFGVSSMDSLAVMPKGFGFVLGAEAVLFARGGVLAVINARPLE